MNTTIRKIGFVGIGAMGTPMAGHLADAGYQLAIYDSDPARVRAFIASRQVATPSTLTELGTHSDLVITMLPDGGVVRGVMCGEKDSMHNCVATGLRKGAIVLDMSSSSPVGTRELAPVLEARGIRLMDAPVSGGVKRAVSAGLAIMAGGDGGLLEACRPVLEKMGKQIFHAGPLGAGHAVKALNNYVSAAGLIAACEAAIAAQGFGIDPNVLVDILNASSGMNNTTANKMKQFMLSGAFNAGFSTGLMAKDLRMALEIANATGTAAPLAEPCVKVWNEMERALGAGSDHTEMLRFLQNLRDNRP
ncbi:MAG: NAD(P)-dependent oxidoreductase [Betaproteobacteria bacterium]|nr:NAD(P)-dependent oxidoreductase [Betaproteobacteria bacterium]MDH3436731.1 NAD(P)-dependent oxidoreductase [Betaproteobacteria bacterium]